MRLFKYIATVTVLSVGILCYGCSDKAADKIGFGTVEGSVYINEYFGLRIELPTDWQVQDADAKKRLMEIGKKIASGEDKSLKAAMDASELQTVNLLTIFKYPLGSPVSYNPSLICLAEKVGHLPGIKKGGDYLFQTKEAMKMSQLRTTFSEEIYSENLGGVDFDVLDVEIRAGNKVANQEYYVAILKGYALCFIISFSTEEEAELLNEILESVQFES